MRKLNKLTLLDLANATSHFSNMFPHLVLTGLTAKVAVIRKYHPISSRIYHDKDGSLDSSDPNAVPQKDYAGKNRSEVQERLLYYYVSTHN